VSIGFSDDRQNSISFDTRPFPTGCDDGSRCPASNDSQVNPLLDQVPGKTKAFCGDGANDKWKVYETLVKRGTTAIIPPQRNAKIAQHGNSRSRPLSRDEAIRQIRRRGRKRRT
jgi:hypothetical protein